jgi:N6-L-threonylcarbamoyladenine synthase
MKILGIETSCDETGVCLIEASGSEPEQFAFEVLGNALYSQVAIHAQYGGVFPNLAKREHAKNLVPLLKQVLEQGSQLVSGGMQQVDDPQRRTINSILQREPELYEQLAEFLQTCAKPDIDAIAVTNGPGLEPALWVGVNFARALSIVWGIPLIAVNHMEGHIILSTCSIEKEKQSHNLKIMRLSGVLQKFDFPVLSLLISGGHTELVLSRRWLEYERLGETRDDAVGEAFDKVARMLLLPYPGGPHISRLASEARSLQSAGHIAFTPPMLHSGDYDFSFSGLKTEVRKVVEKNQPLSEEMKKEIALAFENAVTAVLVAKTMKAAKEYGVTTVVLGGGVSANAFIRHELANQLQIIFGRILISPPDLATDNALMIALAGYFHALKNDFADPATLRADGNLKLGSTSSARVADGQAS